MQYYVYQYSIIKMHAILHIIIHIQQRNMRLGLYMKWFYIKPIFLSYNTILICLCNLNTQYILFNILCYTVITIHTYFHGTQQMFLSVYYIVLNDCAKFVEMYLFYHPQITNNLIEFFLFKTPSNN